MLRFLILICFVNLILPSISAGSDDLKWAKNLTNSAKKIVWEDLKQKAEMQEKINIENTLYVDKFKKRDSCFYMFVSSSMGIPLLRSYLEEAKKYDVVLVFKGLPNGSFKEFAKLIIDLVDADDSKISDINIQIDDEAFEKFDVTMVPTMVLVKEEETMPGEISPLIYDKIVGNVGIKYALEQFSFLGDLRNEAKEYLTKLEGN